MGGGISFTSRHLGLGIDNVVSFEVVTSEGDSPWVHVRW